MVRHFSAALALILLCTPLSSCFAPGSLPLRSAGSSPRIAKRPLALQAQLDPVTLHSVASALPAITTSSVAFANELSSHVDHHALLLATNPAEDLEAWIKSHPLQDAGLLAVSVFTLNALKAGASLPVAIVAGCLELLQRIPGWTMIGQKPLLKLLISIAIDLIGVFSYLIPLVGEVGDLGWAPASAILVKALYGSNVLSSLDLVEEVLPGTDLFPTASLGWAFEYVPGLSQLGWVSGMAGAGAAIGGKKDKA
uniref:Uncharacterized protein n=2 Tax=Hemiselmis andersenii TaxID=464988 RepID=A0A7S1MTH8_HEMAN|mmetsp:Transcript_55111/g.133471  ORF Transcript_55111/g.133471 Transcript_55111/m.133471 type:complete len:253 (+) Transcript_55111:37-795(+)